jgi:cytochrome c553
MSRGLKEQGLSNLSSTSFRWLVVAMALSLLLTMILGVVMAFRFGRARNALLSLAAGIIVPALFVVVRVLGLFFICTLWSCSKAPVANVEIYKPGLGEIMGLQQMRHAKLWFAGDMENWDLAAYELDELREGFDDAVKYHPTHENVPRPLAELIPQFTASQIASLDQAIKTKNRELFAAAYDSMTASCNGCHQASNHGFNVIKRPTLPPFSNQDFAPRK